MIAEITPPIMTIWSVDPMMDFPLGSGVGVTTVKNEFAARLICALDGAEYVSAALNTASNKLSTIVMRGGINLFMYFDKYNMQIFWLNFIHYMYFGVLLKYNAVVTGGDQ